MPKFAVVKVLRLSVVVDAEDEEEAEEIATNMDEADMRLNDCQYEVTEVSNETIG